MKCNSRIKINQQKIKQLSRAAVTALEKTGETLHTEVVQAEIMPRDTGAMQNENTFVDYSHSSFGRVALVTSIPYARRLYFHPEYDFQTYENAFAQGRWLEPWMPGGIWEQFAPEAFRKFYKREGGL